MDLDLALILSQCRAVLDDQTPLFLSLFLMGLGGGVSHCTGMCGPFVLSQAAARLEAMPAAHLCEWRRLSGAALLPYHLGRVTTYAVLGGVLAAMTGAIAREVIGLKWVSAALLTLSALVMLTYAIPSLQLYMPKIGVAWGKGVVDRVRPLLSYNSGWGLYGTGIALGFIPCGMVYAALAAATSSGSMISGSFAMIAFGLGTAPALIFVGVLGHLAGLRWRNSILRWAPVLMILNAGLLLFLVWKTVH